MRKSRRFYGKRKKISFKNHKHISKPMGGLTSIPVRFRGRRINYGK